MSTDANETDANETDGDETGGDGTDRGDGIDSAGINGRNTPTKRLLRAIAAQAAVLSAAVHLLWAWPRLGGAADPRPYVFVLAGAFIVLVAAATLKADEYRRLYALGAGTLLALLVGYVGWYGTAMVAALTTDPLAIVAKAAEIVGAAAFIALYRLTPPTAVVVKRRRERGDPVVMPQLVDEIPTDPGDGENVGDETETEDATDDHGTADR